MNFSLVELTIMQLLTFYTPLNIYLEVVIAKYVSVCVYLRKKWL